MTALDTPPAAAAAVHTPAPSGARNAAAWARRAPLMPALIFMFIITQLPFVATLVISFIQWNALRPDLGKSFTGFSNYSAVLSDPDFRTSILFTIILTVTVVLVSLVLGLLLTLLLDRPFRGRAAVRTMLIAPTVIWKIFGSSHPPQPDWVTQHPRLSVEMSLICQWTPFMMLILLAGLQSRPADAIEAANMDGATSWQQFKYLTLPHLRQYLELGGLLGSIYVIQNLDAVFTITSGGQGTANLPYSIFFTAHDYGHASAAGVLVVIGSIIIATFALRVVSSLFREETR